MSRVIVLSGVSGVGKTHLRTTDAELSQYPHVDIADVYRAWPEADWWMATQELCRRVRKLLRQKSSTVVVEGYFVAGSSSRRMLTEDAKVGGYTLEFRDLEAPLETCLERIEGQYERGEIGKAEYALRTRMLSRVWHRLAEANAY
jgi:predicted kinase